MYKKYFFSLLVLIALSSAAFGQAARTPFSTFGVGVPYGNALVQNQGMGGIGVSQPQYWSINNQNPALLVYNYYTTFQAGMLVESRTLRSDTTKQKNTNGNLNYLVIAFPVKPGKWTTSFGLMPYTNVNYKLIYTDYVIDNTSGQVTDTVAVAEQGSGGINQLYWSNGIRLHDNWSIGVRASYLFGSVETDYSNLLPPNSSVQLPFVIAVNEQTYVRDFQFTGGLSFSQDSIGKKDDIRISAGLVYNFGADLRTKKSTFVERRNTAGDPVSSDTLINNSSSVTVPSGFIAGVSVGKGTRWSAGIEYASQDWSEFKSVREEDEGLDKAWRVALGGEYTPDQTSNNYFKRVTYRVGLSYEKQPFLINNNQL
ncbi:MAG TPA: hypothetical protein VFU05_13920, partial [Cyclobacteriaceae bacterium]|nr:hypothetical protein [Cyclobacteriaceae bacterium]